MARRTKQEIYKYAIALGLSPTHASYLIEYIGLLAYKSPDKSKSMPRLVNRDVAEHIVRSLDGWEESRYGTEVRTTGNNVHARASLVLEVLKEHTPLVEPEDLDLPKYL